MEEISVSFNNIQYKRSSSYQALPSIRFSSKKTLKDSHTCSSPSTPLEPAAKRENFQNTSVDQPYLSESAPLNKTRNLSFDSLNCISPESVDDVTFGEDILASENSSSYDIVDKNVHSNRKSTTQNNQFVQFSHQINANPQEKFCQTTGKMSFIHLTSIVTRFLHLPFRQNLLLTLLLLFSLTITFPGFIMGFFWGLYLSFTAFLYFFVSVPKKERLRDQLISEENSFIIELEKLERINEKDNFIYKGWMNELIGDYDAASYHVNNSRTVLVRLEKNLLRISRPNRKVLKHAFHMDPTLSGNEPSIYEQSIHDLTDANISLRPERLAKRRWWSRKYPIHIEIRPSESKSNEIVDKDIVQLDKVDDGNSLLRKTLSCDSLHMQKLNIGDVPLHSGFFSDNKLRASLKNKRSPLKYYSATKSLFLFARSAREKERWFHLLREVSKRYYTLDRSITDSSKEYNAYSICKQNNAQRNSIYKRRLSLPLCLEKSVPNVPDVEYLQYISNYIQYNRCVLDLCNQKLNNSSFRNCNIVNMDLGKNKWKAGQQDTDSQLVLSVNALASRIFFDFCRDPYWSQQVREKIESKLATIHLPYFIEKLELSDLNLGRTSPTISSVYAPILDEWGLWLDFEMNYKGGLHLVIETRVNLMKLKLGSLQQAQMEKSVNFRTKLTYPHHYSDETLPESPESSADEEFGSKLDKNATIKERTKTRILSVVDKIASSKYFQGASELKPVKKVLEEISSTRLMLHVDITCLVGTMTVNIPPPPSDRLWYAFRKPPRISIKSMPQVGDRCVDMTTISDWIENKLRLLLEKSLVCPNMDDVIVPAMSGNFLLKTGYNK